jgi:uncharacterized protein with HEPN domain/predicted nucleotidyltransferase
MDREQTIRILREHAGEMRELGVIRLAIFGSVIRDQDRSDSDIDLLVDIDDARRFSLLDHVGLTHFFEDVLGQRVDVVRRETLKPFLRDVILAEAVEIYPQTGTLPEAGRTQSMPPRSPRQRLEDIREAILAAETFTAGRSFADYRLDRMLQLALERNIEIISEASRHIPEHLRAQHPNIPWRKVLDIGNVLRHGYEIVDPKVIWLLVTEDLAPLKKAIEAMIEATEQPGR